MATIPSETEVEAYFLAKEDGVVAGIALAEMVFHEVDPSLKVLLSQSCFTPFLAFMLFRCLVSLNSILLEFRLSGLKQMEIMFIKDFNLEKFTVSYQRKSCILFSCSHQTLFLFYLNN